MEELVNYGALGVMVLGFVMGLVVAKPTHDQAVKDAEIARQQRDELLDDVFNRVVPAIERATEAVKARDALDDAVNDVLVDVRRLLERHRE